MHICVENKNSQFKKNNNCFVAKFLRKGKKLPLFNSATKGKKIEISFLMRTPLIFCCLFSFMHILQLRVNTCV